MSKSKGRGSPGSHWSICAESAALQPMRGTFAGWRYALAPTLVSLWARVPRPNYGQSPVASLNPTSRTRRDRLVQERMQLFVPRRLPTSPTAAASAVITTSNIHLGATLRFCRYFITVLYCEAPQRALFSGSHDRLTRPGGPERIELCEQTDCERVPARSTRSSPQRGLRCG